MNAQTAAWKDRGWALGCAAFLVLLVLAAKPFAELGMVDEWSYAFSAKVLASTGHVAYNGWGAMPLTWILYWGALLIRLLGFSYAVLRGGMLLVSAVTLFVAHRVLRRGGLSQAYSTIGALTLALAPSFYSNAPLFMSDIAGLLALELCFYGVLRALEAEAGSTATWWLVFAAVTNTAVGSCRQIALLGVLLLVPTAWWHLRGVVRLRVLLPVWSCCLVAIVLLLRWFSLQPYTVHEPLLPMGLKPHMLAQFVHVPLGFVFFLLPLPMAFVASLQWRNRTVRITLAVALLASCLAFFVVERPGLGLLKMPYLFDTLTTGGFHDVDRLIGEHAREFSVGWQTVLTGLTWFLSAGVLLYVLCPALRVQQSGRAQERLTDRTLRMIFAPFSAVYFALYATRTFPFDRYLLPLMLLLVLLALRILQRQTPATHLLPWIVLAMSLLAWFNVAALHDVFARYRARVNAAGLLQARGIPRNRVDAGFEFDAWTELEQKGFVTWPGMRLPSGQTQRAVAPARPSPCTNWFVPFTPSVLPDYTVSHSALPCLQVLGEPVRYRTWLSPATRTLLAGRSLPLQ